YAALGERVTAQRRQLPWVPVEKEYVFDTEEGKQTLADLFEGRSQLLAYNIMFGPDYTLGACPGCTNLGDELGDSRVHLAHRDVTLICFSRAPIDRLTAYRERMGWEFPYVSTYASDFPFDFGLALTPDQAQLMSIGHGEKGSGIRLHGVYPDGFGGQVILAAPGRFVCSVFLPPSARAKCESKDPGEHEPRFQRHADLERSHERTSLTPVRCVGAATSWADLARGGSRIRRLKSSAAMRWLCSTVRCRFYT
ncbi:MAG: DUF899 family protein, partial [Pirellulales bacterium]